MRLERFRRWRWPLPPLIRVYSARTEYETSRTLGRLTQGFSPGLNTSREGLRLCDQDDLIYRPLIDILVPLADNDLWQAY